MIHFVLGGARSGKSNFAQQLAENGDYAKVTYVATATTTDSEMQKRIARHQADRPASWQTQECPFELIGFLQSYLLKLEKTPAVEKHQAGDQKELILIDCLTLWLNNLMYRHSSEEDQDMDQFFIEKNNQLAYTLSQYDPTQADIVLVANEVGLGIIPMGKITRQFVDYAGWLNQAVAKAADQVSFICAGLPVSLKSPQP